MRKVSQMRSKNLLIVLPILLVLSISMACQKSIEPLAIPTHYYTNITPEATSTPEPEATPAVYLPVARGSNDATIASPTPDAPVELPAIRTEAESYTVRAGDTLGKIA